MKIHKRILELRPEWTEKVKVVMTSGNKDPEEWADIIGGKAYKKELAKKFKDENDTMKIAIVVDMWLTGFDVPSLATMYVYKPMKDHNLMQAIARVNRVFPEKAGGLIVDYVGIAAALKDAMKRYTKRDQSNYGNNDIKDRAYSEFKERLEICRDLLHGYDYSNFQHGSPAERARLIKGAVNHMIAPDKAIDCKDFIKNASLLRQAVTLCRSLLIGEERFEVGFMESVRTLIVRLQRPGKVTKREIITLFYLLPACHYFTDDVTPTCAKRHFCRQKVPPCNAKAALGDTQAPLGAKRQVARRDQAHSQKHDAKKDFEREKEEKRRFDDELSYFFCKFAKETETDQETPAPCIRRHTKGRLQDTHCKDVGVTRDTLPPQPTLEDGKTTRTPAQRA